MNYRNKAISAFCKLRRLQEADYNGMVRCVTCGRPVKWNECDGGHFIDRRHRGTELEPDNVWPQCVVCNRFLSGDKEMYREVLDNRLGKERVEQLEAMAEGDHIHKDYESLYKSFLSQIRRIRKLKGL
nr:recombination protein NinG [uncultured Sphaerochaeta sp.]